MAKRGQKSTHRVRFEWENGVKGTISCRSEDQAQMKVSELQANAERRDMRLQVSVEAVAP